MRPRVSAIASVLLLAPVAFAAPAEVVNVEVRPGVTMRYLQITPDGQPRASVILLAGGNGVLRLSPSGAIGDLSLNIRERLFVSLERNLPLRTEVLGVGDNRTGTVDYSAFNGPMSITLPSC